MTINITSRNWPQGGPSPWGPHRGCVKSPPDTWYFLVQASMQAPSAPPMTVANHWPEAEIVLPSKFSGFFQNCSDNSCILSWVFYTVSDITLASLAAVNLNMWEPGQQWHGSAWVLYVPDIAYETFKPRTTIQPSIWYAKSHVYNISIQQDISAAKLGCDILIT